MSIAELGIFKIAEQRLAWAGQRQQVLAQNVANSSTPGYTPKDIASFESVLSGTAQAPQFSRTNPLHMTAATSSQPTVQNAKVRERAPDGNSVSLEDELTKVADTASTQELVTNLYRKYQGLFRIALGRGG